MKLLRGSGKVHTRQKSIQEVLTKYKSIYEAHTKVPMKYL